MQFKTGDNSVGVCAAFTLWPAAAAKAGNFIAKSAPRRINPVQHLGGDQTGHMTAAKAGCAPDIQLFTQIIDNFQIKRQINLGVIQVMHHLKRGHYAGNAVKPATSRHGINVRSDNHLFV